MNAEQYISIADALRSRALHAGADINASNYLVHATLMRALREERFTQIDPDALQRAAETTPVRPA